VDEPKKRILVVDDEAIIAMDTSAQLRRHGYETVVVYRGDEAIAAATSDSSIDLVLLDIDLGEGMDGTAAATEILSRRELPILFLTSHREQEMVRRVRDITRYGYVVKGTGDFVLISSIEMALDLFDAHRRAREGEERYRSLVESIREIIYEVDLEGIIRFVSPAVTTIFGYDPAALTGRNAMEFVHPDDRELLRTRIPLAGADGPSVYRFLTSTGEYRWVTTHTRAVPGSPGRARGSLVDITELKEAEQARNRSEQRQERAELIAGVGNWEFDLGNRRVYASAGARELYGIENREWNIPEIQTVPLPEYRDMLDHALTDLVTSDVPYDVRFRIRRPSDGRIVEIRSLAEYDRERNTVFGVIQDVTKQNRVQTELRESLDYLHAVLDSVNDAVFVQDAGTGRVLDVNETACRMYGRSKEELLGLDIAAISAGVPPYAQADAERWMELARQGTPQIFNWNAKDSSGRTFPVEVNILYAVIGGAKRFLVTVRDISGRLRTEHAVRELLEEKEMLLREVHHRIKNNISVIASLLSLQSMRVDAPAAKAAIVEAEGRVRTIGTLFDKLHRSTDFRHVGSGEYLTDLIGDIFRSTGGAERGITLELNIKPFTMSARACVPVGLILNELLSNAVKHAFRKDGPGRVTIDCGLQESRILIRVIDDGAGLPGPLESLGQSGLGLTIVNALVKQLSGTMAVESVPGEGTSFSVSITDPELTEK